MALGKDPTSFFFACGYPVFPAPFVGGKKQKPCCFPHWMVLAAPLNISGLYMWAFISGLSVLFHCMVCMSVFMPVPHCFHHCSLVMGFKIGKCEASSFVSFKIVLAIQGLLLFYMNFRMGLPSSTNEAVGNWIAIAPTLLIASGDTDTEQ